jgi:hypothetical protein
VSGRVLVGEDKQLGKRVPVFPWCMVAREECNPFRAM